MIPLPRRPHETGLPDVTPILDVVFILLIFFVIAAAFTTHGVDMNLPRASTARTYAGRSLEIVLRADGSLLANTQEVDLRELGFKVKGKEGAGGGLQIVLKADRDASVGMFLATINTIRDNGGERLVIATKPAARSTALLGQEP